MKWTSGAAITLIFSMKAPNNLTSNLVDQSKDEQTRAAWNSFAYTSDNSQVVEPERVGIVVNATEPVIHKDVEEKQQLDLTNRDQAFDGTSMLNLRMVQVHGHKQASLTKSIHSVLKLGKLINLMTLKFINYRKRK